MSCFLLCLGLLAKIEEETLLTSQVISASLQFLQFMQIDRERGAIRGIKGSESLNKKEGGRVKGIRLKDQR